MKQYWCLNQEYSLQIRHRQFVLVNRRDNYNQFQIPAIQGHNFIHCQSHCILIFVLMLISLTKQN